MKLRFVDDVEEHDALSHASPNDERRQAYNEWHHFTLNDDANGMYGIFNLALAGNVRNPMQARAGMALAVYERGRGWHGTMNLHPLEDARFTPGCIDLNIGRNFVRFRRGRYQVSGALKDGSVALDATWTPRTSALRVDSIGGVVNTFILPSLRVDGVLRVKDRTFTLASATGYHDHNWGYWAWGAGLRWHWGYAIQPAPGSRKGRAPVSIVFGQVSGPNAPAGKADHALAVWAGDRCLQIFLGESVSITTAGALTGAVVPRIPGVMALLSPGRPAVPQQMIVRARDGDDSVDIELAVAGAAQFLVPRTGAIGSTTISELVGHYTVRTMVAGVAREFSYYGFAEVAG